MLCDVVRYVGDVAGAVDHPGVRHLKRLRYHHFHVWPPTLEAGHDAARGGPLHTDGGAPMPSAVVSHTAQRDTSDERTTAVRLGITNCQARRHDPPGPRQVKRG